MIIDKPWGYEEILHKGIYVIKRLNIAPKQRLSRQFHNHKTETLLVEYGVITYEQSYPPRDDFIQELHGIGDVIHIEPHTVHRIGAGESGAAVLEVSTPELDDVVRLEDDYQRVPEVTA